MKIEGAKKILVLDPFLPMPDRNAGGLRLFRILEMLKADGHDITFAAISGHDANNYQGQLESIGVKAHAGDPAILGPVAFGNFLRQHEFDVVVISFYDCARQFLPQIREHSPATKVIIDTVDLHFLREERAAALTGNADDQAAAAKTRTAELKIYAEADHLIAISETEARLLQELLPEVPVSTVGIICSVATATPAPREQRHGLSFVGNFWHRPNAEGILWFCQEVLPLVRAAIPTITVDVIGQNPPARLAEFESIGVRTLGWVPSTTPYLRAARLSIAPLLHGAGQKGKVIEALSNGLPVVTTSIGAEGLGLTGDTDIVIADGAQEFAAAVVRTYSDAGTWNTLAQAGRTAVLRAFTPEAVVSSVRQVIPPSPAAPLRFFAVPDWSDLAPLTSAVVGYANTFKGSTTSTFDIGVVEGSIDVQQAFQLLVEILNNAGLDPETIPNVGITPVAATDLEALAANTVWVPLTPLSTPKHLKSLDTLAAESLI